MNAHISLLIVFCAFAISVRAQTTVPSGMTYQGRLTDSNGTPSPDGTGYEIEVRLWTTATGGTTPIWAARYAGIPLKNGGFSLILGAPGGIAIGGAIADLKTVFTTTQTTYLGLTVTKGASGAAIPGAAEILPRQQLFSTPYAFRSEVAASVDPNAIVSASIKNGEVTTADIADGIITNAKLAQNSVNLSNVLANSLNSSAIASKSIDPDRLARDFAILIDERPQGTAPDTSLSSAWKQRTLNTVSASSGTSITLSGNAFTLKPGKYRVTGQSPVYEGQHHTAAIRKSGSTQIIIKGTSEHSYNNVTSSMIDGLITVTGSDQQFELWHYNKCTRSN